MGSVFFVSDLHIGHKLVSGLRGFENTDDHDRAIFHNWCSVVKRDDLVWVLGDVTVSNGQLDRAIGILGTLPGRKRLVFGNHDPGHPAHRDAHKFQRKYLEVFESAQAFGRIKLLKKNILLSHFPYTLDHTHDARYEQWRLPDRGEFLIHGHTHSSEKITSKREFNVALEAWNMFPVPQEEVIAFIS